MSAMPSLRQLRERRGLTQMQLAKVARFQRRSGAVVHLEQTTVSALERGLIDNPKKTTLEALARGLDVTVIDVWHGLNVALKERERALKRQAEPRAR